MPDVTKEDVVKFIENMSVLEMSEFVKELEERFGVSAQPMVAQAAPSQASEEAKEEEKTEFDVVLKEIGQKKIQLIKAVREITGLGLKEAKELVDKTPTKVKQHLSKEEAESIKAKIEEAGATVEIE
ncbi:MAG: 50S ribosomal protein L7/L12 [Deltaproteobacteria bacterium]|nr:50S ribosomal protein L7/L12 [Deltaproteobacteria bacterium]